MAHSTLSYGLTNSYGLSVDDQSGSGTTIHNVKLSSLESGVTYHFKISGTDSDGNVLSSDDYQFDTLPLPKIENLKITSIPGKPRSAFKASWTTNVPTTTILKYRHSTDGQYLESTRTESETSHVVEVDGLLDDSTYYIIAQGRDSSGNLAESEVQTFRTALDTRSPVVSNVSIESSMVGADAKGKNRVIVRWNTDEPTTSMVEYGAGLSGGYTGRTSEEVSMVTEHLMMVSGLEGQTPYHLHVIVKDKGGNKTESESQTFTTGSGQSSVWQMIARVLNNLFGFVKIK